MNALAIVLVLFVAQDKKPPVPDAGALKDAEKTVRELFKDDFAKKAAADRRTLAKKLLSQGRDAGNTPASQYVLLTLAVDQAVQAPDPETALLAGADVCKLFAVDPVAQRVGTLAALSKAVKSPEDLKTVAKAYLELCDEALRLDDFDNATKAAGEAATQARRLKELALVGAADAKTKEVGARKIRFEKVRKAVDTLGAAPDDPAANLAVGQYTCFVKGDWKAGLALLAKGPDGPIKTAAIKDAGNPQAPDDRAAAGDLWWDLSESAAAEDKTAIRDRAGWWYQQVGTKIAGLGKVKVDKRLVQWNTERIGRGAWVDFTDPSAFGLKGRPGEPLEVVAKGNALTPVSSKSFPAGEYDGWSLRVRFKMDEPACDLMYKGPGYPALYALMLRGKARTLQIPGEKGPAGPVQILPIAVADEYVVTVLHEKEEDIVFLNGVELGRFPNPHDHFDSFQFYFRAGTTTLDKIRLRKR